MPWLKDEKEFQGINPQEWSLGKKIYILALEVNAKVAVVKLQFGEKWHDVHQLVKVGPTWKFVNKISQQIT